jgi:deoxycytidylate deaminase
MYVMETFNEENKKKIEYPYLPEGRTILYVPESNQFIQEAKRFAKENSLDSNFPTGSVLVKDNKIIGFGANGSDYHKNNTCERIKNNIPTGQGYELCEGCHPKNHSERKAIKNAIDSGLDSKGTDLYLWGHWWCCEPCWQEMISSGIKNVYLMEGSDTLFDKNNPNNKVGHQFE